MRLYLLTLILTALTATSNVATHAVVVISNLEEPWPEPGTIGEIHGVFPGETYGVEFWTGEGSFTVDSVTLEHILFYDPTALPNFRVQIYKEVVAPPFPNIT